MLCILVCFWDQKWVNQFQVLCTNGMLSPFDVIGNNCFVLCLWHSISIPVLHERNELQEVLIVNVQKQLICLFRSSLPFNIHGLVIVILWLIELSPIKVNMTQWKSQVKYHIKCYFHKCRIIPLLKETNNNFLYLFEIPNDNLRMILVKTLDHLGIPLDLILIFSRESLLDILKEKVGTLHFLMTLLFLPLAIPHFLPNLSLLYRHHSTIYLFKYFLTKLRLDKTTNYRKKLVCLSMPRNLV